MQNSIIIIMLQNGKMNLLSDKITQDKNSGEKYKK